MFENDGRPLEQSEDTLERERPGPHIPRYQSTEMKRKNQKKSLPSLHDKDKAFNGHPVYYKDNQGHASKNARSPSKSQQKPVKLPKIQGINAFGER